MAITADERKSKADLIQELESLRAQLASNAAAQQLAVIQEIEKALADEHDLDAIYTAVGNKLIEIFDAQVIGIYEADLVNQKMHFPWSNERGVEDRPDPVPLNSLYRHTIEQGGTLLINEGFAELAASFEDYRIPYGLAPKSVVAVPVVKAKDRWLSISLQDMEKEHAFSPEDVRLLELLAATMGTALENARLFEETSRRNAELAIINSVQQGLAAKLDIQSIVEMVGEKVREIFQADTTIIATYEYDSENAHYRYIAEKGDRFDGIKVPFNGFHRELIRTRKTILYDENLAEQVKPLGFEESFTPHELPKSALNVPLIAGGELIGHVALEDMENEHAFSQSDVRLLETLANSMSVALDNARLFDETNQRNAELAVINSVQEGLAAELEFQGIIDLVGDKLREVLKTEDIGIRIYDRENDQLHFYYEYEHGERIQIPSGQPGGLSKLILESMKPLYGPAAELEQLHSIDTLPGTDASVALLAVPIMKGAHPIGLIRVEDFHNENAFTESDVRLLETLANSMSVALENARLFEETQSRNAELAVINSVQTALAAELDLQGIYDLVGDKIQEIFGAQAVIIGSFDHEKGLQQANYFYEKGEREYPPQVPITGLMKHVIESGETLVFNENAGEETKKYGAITLGEEPKSAIFVPLIAGSKVTGAISLQDVERDHAYQESDVRLLETLANSMSVALENARLFEETNQRNAELAIINTVQEGLAAELDMRGIYQLVGDKIGEITGADVVMIGTMKWEEDIFRSEYFRDGNQTIHGFERPVSAFHLSVRESMEAGETQVLNHGIEDLYKQLGHVVAAGKMPKTMIAVPMRVGREYTGFVSLQDTEREFAFDESTIRLVETLTRNMEIALENARLFEETQARNAELAVINSVQQGLASKLEMQAIYDLVGDKVSEITGSEIVVINTWDTETGMARFEYIREKGERFGLIEREMTPLNWHLVPQLEAGNTIIQNENVAELLESFGHSLPAGEMPKTVVSIPLKTGGKVNTSISLQDTQREHAFDESTIRLVETLARSMGIALENARLFDEVQRSNKEISEALGRETASNDILRVIAESPADIQPVLDAIAESAAHLSDSEDVVISLADDETLWVNAHYGEIPMIPVGEGTPLNEDTVAGSAILQRQSLQAVHHLNGDETEFPQGDRVAAKYGYRMTCAVPMIRENKAIGTITIRRTRPELLNEKQIRLIESFANQAAIAVENVRLFNETQRLLKETEERNAELAVINSVQEGLASKLEIQSIYDLVGDKLREIFKADTCFIAFHNEDRTMVTAPYYADKTSKGPLSRPYGKGIYEPIVESGKPVVFGSAEETKKMGRYDVASPGASEDLNESVLGVPIFKDGQAIGAATIQSYQKNAYTQSDLRLLQTLTNSMSVALESARLFDETQRLLKETEERNEELAIINMIGQTLTQELDLQSLIDLVGDKIRAAVHAENIGIGLYDKATNLLTSVYVYRNGERVELDPLPLSPYNQRFAKDGKSLVLNSVTEKIWEKVGSNLTYGDEIPKSVVLTPILAGGELIGGITLQNFETENAYPDSQVRLLETIASNMGTAMQNARLFDETQRLLKETEERNAELAVINSVQEGLAAELDFQGIVDLVGNTLRDVLDTGNIGIRIFDPEDNILHFAYEIEHGERLRIDSMQPAGLSKRILETSKPYFGPTSRLKEEFHMATLPGTDESKALLAVPIMMGDAPRGLIVVEDFTDEHAYSETDVRLMETLANSMSVALENARLFDELQNSNREISAALERQTATGDILQIMANSPGEIQPVLEAVAEHAAKLVEADDVQIYQADDVKLVQMAHYGPLPALKDGESLPLDAGLATGRAVLERRTIQLDAGNLSEEEYPISVQLQKRLKHRTVVMTPLVREGNAVGAIVARRNEVREYSETQVDLLRTFANQAAIAIENVRLFEETKRLLSESMQQAEELKTVNTVSTALSSELELDALIELIGSQVRKIFSADVAYVGLLNQATGMIEFPFSYGEETRPLKLGEGLTSRVILEGQPLLINQDEEWNKTQGRIGVKSKSYLGVPISVGKDVIGVISVQSTQWTNMYGQKEVRLLSTIAANVGAAIANANLFNEVERQKVYLEALISSAPVAIVTIDLDGNVSGWSPAAEELYGYTPEEAFGRNIDDLVANHPSIREEAENYTSLNLEQPGPNQIQLKTQRTHKDGRLIDVTVSAMPVYIEGERRGYIAIYNDISQLEKARRDAEEANQAKSAFLANMSHELRTPLNAIIGFTRIVKRKGEEILPDKQIDNLDKVLVSAEHLLGLINTVLDISKIEAGRMDIHVSSFDLKPLIDLVMVTTQPLVRQDHVDLVSDVADGLPMVQSDLEKIKQILINLLSNAAKFTHQGEIKVAVRESGGQISVDVSDTGIGISPEAVERVFEEFQQADVSTTREYGGTGLGLSISRSLARLLGGDLTVTSEQGKGSVFTLTFPVNFAQQEETPGQEEFVAKNVEGHLVLVIDDNEDAIYLMRENLESAGYQVAVARNGEEGLAMAKELNPFAITLDIMMPKKDGWQVLHDLKQNPETRSIPVVMISIVDKKALGYRLGAADYLVKPLNEDQVLVSLDKLKKENGDKPLKRLLVVDDDPNIADMVRQLLEDSHYQIEEARDGQEAWEQIEANPPDAILLDLMMPRLDGFGLIEKLKQSEAFADLPVIVLTAKLLNEGERNALSDSVGKVIQKQGLSGEALLAEISNSIRTSI